ncbi:EpsG-like putative glucosyltransferase [Mariniflexile fucanivorans]|uniref:EpsG-like putative glucosyltransferase n=1 Tax=Mariniflexile fucanivorans TaxID=264023 RepID=A0A4R1RS01_9FLAO|nr:EpsG family protein [Mariniflexile fucanivorans]TCL69235.1 EpsG-like putative glucosyltransferase [Mariniflexile fucanivorans]
MFIYILFFIVVFLLLEAGKYKIVEGVNFYWLAYFFIFIFSAFRFDVGYDFEMYYNLIEGKSRWLEAQLNRFDFLSRELVIFSSYIKFTQFFFIVSSFLIMFLTYKVIKRESKDFVISTLVFLSFPIFFLNSFSIVRQYMALSIVFYSLRYISSRKLLYFLIAIFVAVFFHKTAIVAIVLYWIYNLKLKNIHFIIIFIGGFFSSKLLYFLVEYLLPHYLKYLDENVGVGGDKLLLLFQIIGFFILFFVDKKKEDLVYNFYINTFYVGLFIWSSLAPYGHAGYRGALYFIVFFILLAPEVIQIIKQRRLLKQITYIVGFCFFIFTLWLGTKNIHKDPNIPYRVFFLTDKTHFKSVTP